MLTHAAFFFTLTLAAAVFALLEIQIEGAAGWATSLPTWRVENRMTRLILGRRALTGYHLYFHLFVLTVLHAGYTLVPAAFSLAIELRILAFAAWFWVLEDCLWFVFNPAFGMHRFTREHAWWHAGSWWWILPRDYWLFVPLGALLYALSWQ